MLEALKTLFNFFQDQNTEDYQDSSTFQKKKNTKGNKNPFKKLKKQKKRQTKGPQNKTTNENYKQIVLIY